MISVRVPATSANLGPGYDAVGLALSLSMRISLDRSPQPVVEVRGTGAELIPRGPEHPAYRAARFVAELTRALTKHGATFCWSTDVTDWRTDGKRVHAVQTSRGELTADEFVLAGGAWSGWAARDLGLFLPVQAGKGYSVTLPTAPQRPSICAILTEARVAVTPMDGALLRFAGTMEIGGLDTAINRRRVKGMLKSIPRYFPEFQPGDFAALPVWAGLRPCSPDGLPYIGRPRLYANLVIATGHAMMGVSLAPITGKLVAEIVSDQSPSIETELLRPDRYERTPS